MTLSRTPWVELGIGRSTFYRYVKVLKYWQKQELIRASKEKRTPIMILYVLSGRERQIIQWDVDQLRNVLSILNLADV